MELITKLRHSISVNKNASTLGKTINKFFDYFRPVGSYDSPNEVNFVWSGTQAQYDALEEVREDTLYFIEE